MGLTRPGLTLLLLLAASVQAQPQAIDQLPLQGDGDIRTLPAGTYRGNFTIDHPLHLRCAPGAQIDGQGTGSTLHVRVPGVVIEGCSLRNWGRDLTAMDAAIFIDKAARGTVVRGNDLQGAGFGIWLDATTDVQVLDNRIQGDPAVRSQDRGNGIHLYAVRNALVRGNQVRQTRDGVYIDTSNDSSIEDNLFEDLRYGVHYMFTHNSRVIGNTTRHTRTGYALMQSRKLTVVGNRSVDDQNYGILMNYITYSTLTGNHVEAVRSGEAAATR
jgi:Nitrous oxidase accessory protein